MEQAAAGEHGVDESRFSEHVNPRRPCILVAEDDFEMRKMVVWALKSHGFDTVECPDGLSLMMHLGVSKPGGPSHAFDLVIADVRMPGISAIKALEKVVRCPPLIVITAFGDADTHAAVKRLGAVEVFDKPFDMDDLIAVVTKSIPATAQRRRQPEAGTANKDVTVGFPCEIVLRHEAGKKEPLRAFVRSLAEKLSRFTDLIDRCTVVIEESVSKGKGASQYHVDVKLETQNRTIIAGGGTDGGVGHSNLYGAITSAFHAVRNHLKQELRRGREQSRKGALPRRDQ